MRLLILFFSLLPALAWGNAKVVGNGGDAVVCRDNTGGITSVELFDYYEARILRGLNIRLPEQGSVEQIALNALQGMKKWDPERYSRYRAFIHQFSGQIKFIDGDLVDIPDSDHLVVPHSCAIEQLVIRQTTVYPEDRQFLVKQSLWEKMSAAQRAGAILHEAFYGEALSRGAEDSRAARYFHSKWMSVSPENLNEEAFLKIMRAVSGSGYFPLASFRALAGGEKGLGIASYLNRFEMEFSPQGDLQTLRPDPSALTPPFMLFYLIDGSPAVRLDSCFPKSISFQDGPAQTVAFHGVTQCEFNLFHSDKNLLLRLAPGSDLILSQDGISFTLSKDSCYRSDAKSYCGQEIVIGPSGELISHK